MRSLHIINVFTLLTQCDEPITPAFCVRGFTNEKGEAPRLASPLILFGKPPNISSRFFILSSATATDVIWTYTYNYCGFFY